MAFKSSSEALPKLVQGIGGSSGLELSIPLYLPSRNALMNCFSDHDPMPVSSELILAA